MSLARLVWLRVAVALALLLLLSVMPAMAQDDDEEGPWYDVPALESKSPWLPWLIGTLLSAACVLIALKNPHRSHLD